MLGLRIMQSWILPLSLTMKFTAFVFYCLSIFCRYQFLKHCTFLKEYSQENFVYMSKSCWCSLGSIGPRSNQSASKIVCRVLYIFLYFSVLFLSHLKFAEKVLAVNTLQNKCTQRSTWGDLGHWPSRPMATTSGAPPWWLDIFFVKTHFAYKYYTFMIGSYATKG